MSADVIPHFYFHLGPDRRLEWHLETVGQIKVKEADACLIAAAPELLEACKGLIEDYELEYGERHCDCQTEPENEGHVCNVCKARMAVANAEGRV